MKELNLLEKKLGLKFKDKNLLIQAFVHRSYLNENPELGLEQNERLEFLGDAVLELVVTEYLYNKYPEKAEGELTNWRAALVNAKMLSKLSEELGFNNFLLLSKGEAKELGKARQYILANTFEAFVGSLYIDLGYGESEKFIKKYLLQKLPEIIEKKLYQDAKSHFQEQAQDKVSITPAYKVIKEWGPDHKKKFTVGVYLEDELVAEGEGSSKQEAEDKAAKDALLKKNWN
ncbi:MAG: ribonuclease III [Patescibacteria group bacterium]